VLNALARRNPRAVGLEPAAQPDAQKLDVGSAHVLLANLGFLLVPGPPLDHGAAYLLVAVRAKPTLAHFDPERINYWALDDAHAAAVEITWPLPRIDSSFSWGTITIADRLGAENRFVSFGGRLTVSRDRGVHAALFRSDAPILSLGGHSGPAEALGPQGAAFLATVRGAAGYDSPVKKMADSIAPVALYATFVLRAVEIYGHTNEGESVSPHLISLLRSERHRLDTDNHAEVAAGQQLNDLLRNRQSV
jgi:hypothetical protein